MALSCKTAFCILYIFIFLLCSRGEAIKISSNSMILRGDPAVQDMELKPRQVKARPRVVRRNQLYYRPNLSKYPRGAVYSRYRVPPMYVTFRCPPRVGLLLCRASCERRRRNTIGSCDNGYCTCLLLTPGFRGRGGGGARQRHRPASSNRGMPKKKKKTRFNLRGIRSNRVFARRANCALQAYKCHRFCQYQFGNSAYGSCRGNVCRCFTNPGISFRNQPTACEQARRRLAYLEARIRYILRKRPSERSASDMRLLRQVAKAPHVVNRIARKKQHSPTPTPKRPSSKKDKRPSSSQGKGKESSKKKRQDDDEDGDGDEEGEEDEEEERQDFQTPQGKLPKPAGKTGQEQYPQVPGQGGGRDRLADDPRQQNHLGRDDPQNYPGSQYLDPEEQAQVEDPKYRPQNIQKERLEDGHNQRPGQQEGGKLNEGACPLKQQGQHDEREERDPRERQDYRDPRDPRNRDEEIEKLAEFEEEEDPALMKQFEDIFQGLAPIRDKQSELAAERGYDQYRQNPVYGNFLDHTDHQYRQREEPPPEKVSRNAAQADRLLI